MKIFKIFFLSFVLLFGIGLAVSAQETQTAADAVNLDEDVQASNLGIGEPSILPDNPLYFLKNWGRGIQSFFTFNPIAKSELKEKFANEKLLELKKTIEQKKNAGMIKEATENYQQEVERVKEQVEKIKETVAENPKVENFLDKFIQQQILHQKLLQKLEEQVPQEAFEKIKEARETHLEGFQNVILKLEDRMDKITEKLDRTLEKQKGSEFKEFKNLEVLKNLEEKIPEQAKEAIQKAQENSLKRLQGDLEKMSSGNQEKFKEYLDKISGEKEKHLEILEDIKAGIKIMPTTPGTIQLQEKLEKGKSGILEKIGEQYWQIGCPGLVVPPGFCKEGRVIITKDPRTGCILPPRCIEVELIPKPGTLVPPGVQIPKPGVCITLWDPICGKNGKTYSSKCFAKVAGVEIVHEGVCEETKCPEIQCVWDPCPGEHIPDPAGCVSCASPCKNKETPPLPPGSEIPPSPPGRACAQVITPAISPDGICKEFPTPCNVPENWQKVDKCPITE